MGGVCLCPLFSQVVHAEFIADSKAELTLRNFTLTETIKRSISLYSSQRLGAGFNFKGQTGYTEGTVGFGVDVLAMAGFNLMGSRADDYARSGLLPVNTDNSRDDYYGKIGITGKAKFRKMSFCGRFSSAITDHIFIASAFVSTDLSWYSLCFK